MELKKKLILILPVTVFAAALDLYTKSLAVQYLRPKGHNGVAIIQNFFELQYAENRGMLFGLGQGISTALLVGLSLLVVAAMIYFIIKIPYRFKVTHVAFALVLAGAIGNRVDRIHLGYVVDFILWRYYEHIWPNFNFADVYITVGVGLLFAQMLFSKEDPFGVMAEKDGKENQKK